MAESNAIPSDLAQSSAGSFACSVGIMAHNEEANIAHAITSILDQRCRSGYVAEVIVVASGCTDRTVPIVSEVCASDSRVRLIVQERREGKASAINLFLAASRSPILVMVSADVVLKAGTLDTLVGHFHDPMVGMVGAHPIPVNDRRKLLGYAVHLLWELHDVMARAYPKLGEVVAFRNVVPSIPFDTAVDEISIQALVTHLGYRLVYEPRAVVYNRGSTSLGDFMRQRRRIYAGHLRIRQQQRYTAPTMSTWRIMRALMRTRAFATPRSVWRTVATMALEGTARALGRVDYMFGRSHHVWAMARTTKHHIAEEANAWSRQSVLVFRITGFHAHEIELGARASQQLVHEVQLLIRKALPSAQAVTAAPSATIIATVPVERDEAERAAQAAIQTMAAASVHVGGRREGVAVELTCGIITFTPKDQALALALESEPAIARLSEIRPASVVDT